MVRLISTGLQIGQAVKNVQRLRQIIAVFSRHGFEDVLIRMNLVRMIPTRWILKNSDLAKKHPAQRLREAFEELGPTFVKLGQVLSTRPDLIPEAFIEEFSKLQDRTQPVPFDAMRTVIESEFSQPLETLFAFIDPVPLASASIAQVHEARLPTGEKVVIKVQRPGIESQIKNDISLMTTLAKLMERYVPETRLLNPSTFVDEFFKTLTQELDFHLEANSMQKFAANMQQFEAIVVPRIYKAQSSRRVLTQEKLEGVRVTDIKGMEALGIDRRALIRVGARAFFKSVMIDGLFHGDLHAGNVFALPGNKLGLIDFGIMGRLSERSRERLVGMFVSLMQEDYEHLCYTYAELGAVDAGIDFEAFERNVRSAVSPFMGLNLSEVNTGRVLVESTKIAAKFNIRVPGEWMVVFRALLTVEGMGRQLDPDFDMMTIGRELAADLVKSQLSLTRFKKDFVWILRDVAALLQVLPRQLRWMFRKFNRDSFAFEIKIPQIDGIRREMAKNGQRVAFSILAVGLIYTASQMWISQAMNAWFAGGFYAIGFVLLARVLFL